MFRRNDKQPDQKTQELAVEALRRATEALERVGGLPSYRRVFYSDGWPAERPRALLVDAYGGSEAPPWITSVDFWYETVPIPGETIPAESTLIGVGGPSDSMAQYPPTGPVTTGDLWVDPQAVSNGDGSQMSPFDNLEDALAAVSDGERIIVRAGTLTPSSRYRRATAWTTGIEVFAYGDERPVLDASALGTGSAARILTFDPGSAREHWKGFHIKHSAEIAVLSAGDTIKLEDLWISECTPTVSGHAPLRIQNEAADNLVMDVIVWDCGDGSTPSSNAPDCFQVTHGTTNQVTTGHRFVRCAAGHGADDGFDLFRASDVEIIESIAYRCGYYSTGVSAGDGSGFKLGGANSAGIGNNAARGCIAVDCKSEAFKPNSSPLAITAENCTSVGAVGYGFNFSSGAGGAERHSVKNCIDFDSGTPPGMNPTYVVPTRNSWNLGIVQPDFASPETWDFSLSPSSPAIGAGENGVNLGASAIALELAKKWIPVFRGEANP